MIFSLWTILYVQQCLCNNPFGKYNFPKQERVSCIEADILKTIGENTRKYRTRAGLTQAELAEKVGVGTSFISRVERGQKRMRIETLLLVAAAMHISVDLLLCQEDQNQNAQL